MANDVTYYQRKKIRLEQNRRRKKPEVKAMKDTAPFLITLKSQERSTIKCRFCRAVEFFDHNPVQDYATTEKGLRKFKSEHAHRDPITF